jgi:hypothetical protein
MYFDKFFAFGITAEYYTCPIVRVKLLYLIVFYIDSG